MKNKFISLGSILLIITGLTLVFIPKISHYIIEKRTVESVIATEDIPSEILQANLQTDSEFDFDSILEINPSQTFLSSGSIDEDLLIGRLLIPSIDLNLSIYNGVTNSILNIGVGTMKPNLEMGKGNFPIAGHYSSNEKTLFGDLTSLVVGDLVYITDNDTIYEYKVYDTKTVESTETEWIQDKVSEKVGKPIVSLMNCYYVDGKSTNKRYFVFAELLDSYTAY